MKQANFGMCQITTQAPTPPLIQTLPLVRPSFANVNLMKAIFGLAWAVAVPPGDDMVMG